MSTIVVGDDRPLVGYKLIKLKDGFGGLATVQIPPDAIVVKTDYVAQHRKIASIKPSYLYRTNKLFVSSIIHTGFNRSELEGVSFRNQTVRYQLGRSTEDMLDTTSSNGQGLHFFDSEQAARLTPVLNK